MKLKVGIFWFFSTCLADQTTSSVSQPYNDITTGYQYDTNISHNWGQYSPFFSVATDIPDEIPENCGVTFVQVLQRHGARYPTSGKSAKYKATISQVLSSVRSFTGNYAFLKDYTYSLGEADLTAFGTKQSVDSGNSFYTRYRNLSNNLTPFVRASGSQRVLDTATNWTLGFHTAKTRSCPKCDNAYPVNIIELSESAGFNNSLDPLTCAQFENGFDSTIGDSAQATFANVFVPAIRKRLNADLPGANLTLAQSIYFMDLCPFETVASETSAMSPFCALFTQTEWENYNHYQTLGKFYSQGWGNPLGASQGVGFVNELIARLTATTVQDNTSTNSTLDSSNSTFPIGGSRQLFADFSHDNSMTSIFSAFGFYNQTGMISNTTVESTFQTYGYSAAWTVPFAGRAFIEKQECNTKCGTKEYVRVIINGRVLPLLNCGADPLGRCKLSAFIDSLTFARNGGDWSQC